MGIEHYLNMVELLGTGQRTVIKRLATLIAITAILK